MDLASDTSIRITGISHDGEGVGRLDDGRVVFVAGALPGETVAIENIQKEKKRLVASLKAIHRAHPERVQPPCPAYDRCGGCQLQHASAGLQGDLKTLQVRDAVSRIGQLDTPVLPTLTMADPWRYRNKGIFHVNEAGGQARLGFYSARSHDFVPASGCLLFSNQVNTLLEDLEGRITATGRAGHIRKVMVRESKATGDLMLAFITEDQAFRLPRLVEGLIADYPALTSVWHNVLTNPRLATGRAWHHLAGRESIQDAIGHLTVSLSPASFFQVNNLQAQVLYDEVRARAGLTGQDHILDLYGGIGTIGLYLADRAGRLTGVESVGEASRDAKANAQALGLTNTHFVTAKAEAWLPRYLKDQPSPDLTIVDPPRKGLDPRLVDTLIQAAIPRIIYVSCNPATLARDLKSFQAQGYQPGPIQPVDLFPQTAHVECVVLLEKVK
ncbi:23S rRNA (uracil(1939)-C(5))-methyltransferase RlmD [Peptococcus simiae]|uniref:23S rRNA (uracil(1939)-C(5))-methyltransferase RlmD n=1 Tax=Peptococcus simiae TaxID=1643805 RepID=UPI00397EC31B